MLTIGMEFAAPKVAERAMILNTIAEKLKRQSKDDFKGRHFEAWLIVQAVAWYLRYPLTQAAFRGRSPRWPFSQPEGERTPLESLDDREGSDQDLLLGADDFDRAGKDSPIEPCIIPIGGIDEDAAA